MGSQTPEREVLSWVRHSHRHGSACAEDGPHCAGRPAQEQQEEHRAREGLRDSQRPNEALGLRGLWDCHKWAEDSVGPPVLPHCPYLCPESAPPLHPGWATISSTGPMATTMGPASALIRLYPATQVVHPMPRRWSAPPLSTVVLCCFWD